MKNSDTGQPGEIPFRSLTAFEATARLGSISRAADELHLTQSAVSQRVLKLEAYVGQRLFLRHGQGVRLTGAGDLLLQTTRETLARLQGGLARIEPYRNKDSLLLACPPDFGHGWLMPRMQALQALHGSMEVWMMPEREFTEIDRIDVDLIVGRRPLHGDDVECVPLLEDRAVAVCGPRTASALAGCPWPAVLEKVPLLFLEREPEWGGLLSGELAAPAPGPLPGSSARKPFKPAGRPLRLRRAATIQDERLLLDAAEQELGLAYVSQVLAAAALADGRVVAVPAVPPSPRSRLWLMRSRLTPRTPLANRVFEWLRSQAASDAGSLS